MLGGIVNHLQMGRLKAQQDGLRLGTSLRAVGCLGCFAHACLTHVLSIPRKLSESTIEVDKVYTRDMLWT
jgi:hypothetical protein